MKNKNIVAILLCIIFASCGEDRRPEYLEKTALNRSIESTMRLNYYWYQTMYENKTINYFTNPPSAFFKNLLIKQDVNSYFEDPTETESLRSYGIEFDASIPFNNDTAYAVRVLYVDSDSPAYEAGLSRGDWIIKRNDKFIIKTRIDSLYRGEPVKLTLGEYKKIKDENGNDIDHFEDKEIINLGAARITSDNPIHISKVIIRSGFRIGYLAYNHFTSGRTDEDQTYDDALRTISNTFRSQDVNEFILDLRYNTGGNLKSAQLLGSILIPQESLGSPMCYIKYNDLQSSRNEEWSFNNEILGTGSNLNLNKLYILTGSTTSSTSDVLINTLKPYISNIIQIGQTTKGNHTGTHAYSDDEYYPYILHPVDCMIHNARDVSPTSGFAPAFTLNEVNYIDMMPLGNENEILLYSALYHIETGTMPTFGNTEEEGTRTAFNKKVPGLNTLENIPARGTSIR